MLITKKVKIMTTQNEKLINKAIDAAKKELSGNRQADYTKCR